MSDLLKSVKEDLTDRRLLPLVVAVCVALLAAVGYAVLGGGSSASTPGGPVATGAPTAAGIAVAQAPANPNQAIAETATGTSVQRRGVARNPFTPLPGQIKKPVPTVSTSAASAKSAGESGAKTTSSTSGSEKAAGGSGSGTTKSTTAPTHSKESKPSKPKTVFKVALQFGVVAPGQPQASEPTTYEGLSKVTPLPSSKENAIELVGVKITSAGNSAVFSLTVPPILHGPASCLPSTEQCRMIELKEGQSEQLSVENFSGKPVTYEVRVVSISSTTATSAAVARVRASETRAGDLLLGTHGVLSVAGLRFSSTAGVLVALGRWASSTRAHGARRGASTRG
jgi:hypothetical protein